MRFTLLDPTNPEREFLIVIDISKQDYAGRSTISISMMIAHRQ